MTENSAEDCAYPVSSQLITACLREIDLAAWGSTQSASPAAPAGPTAGGRPRVVAACRQMARLDLVVLSLQKTHQRTRMCHRNRRNRILTLPSSSYRQPVSGQSSSAGSLSTLFGL